MTVLLMPVILARSSSSPRGCGLYEHPAPGRYSSAHVLAPHTGRCYAETGGHCSEAAGTQEWPDAASRQNHSTLLGPAAAGVHVGHAPAKPPQRGLNLVPGSS